MKHHAKAPSAGSSSSSGRGAPLTPALLAFLLACALALTLLFGVSSASATAPTATAGSASAVEATTATLNGEVDPADLDATSCRFDYVSDSDFTFAQGEYGNGFIFASQFPCDLSELTAGSGPKPVAAALTGLSPATAYHFRLLAENLDGPSESIAASTFTTKAVAPTIAATSVTGLTPTAATLNATINPGGAATAYRFEYVDAATYEASGFATATHLPVPDASAGSGTSDLTVSAKLAALVPDTSYRYRLAASNSEGPATSPAREFTTFPAPEEFPTGAFPGQGFLPDNRAWELVTPSNKNGGNVLASSERTQASTDGDALKFSSSAAFGDAEGTGLAVDYASRRDERPGTSGWSTHAITPRQEPIAIGDLLNEGVDPRYLELSPDLSRGIFLAPPKSALVPSPQTAETSTLSLRTDLLDPGSGTFEAITGCPACSAPLPPQEQYGPAFAAASDDLSHVLFESKYNLTDEAEGAEAKLYESDHGTLRLAGILPDDACLTPPCPALSSVAGIGTGVGTASSSHFYTDDTISADGSRLVFTLPTGAAKSRAFGDLYLRTDHATTVKLNEPEIGSPGAPLPAKFQAASPDLSYLFFTTEERLTPDPIGSEALYRYDATLPASDPHNLTLISADSEPDDGIGGPIDGVIGTGNDGAYVYFYARTQLIDNGGPGILSKCDVEDLRCLYAWHDGTLRLITRFPKGSPIDQVTGSEGSLFAPKASRLSADGSRLLFLSDYLPGEPYDHGSVCREGGGNKDPETPNGTSYFWGDSASDSSLGCAELYLYDATADGGSGKLTCVSCAPGGAHLTRSEARLGVRDFPGLPTQHLNHALSEDGRYVFFSTGERLVPEDTNGRYDAYVYDSVTGQRHLLSSGEADTPSFFLEASPDGHDAFFTTRERLTGWDVDNQIDLYDARIDGGIADPPPPPPSCQGDACQPPPPDLNDPTPASASAIGPGDPVPNRGLRCRKGKRSLKRNGKPRCVAKKRHSKTRAHTSTPSHG